MSFFTTRKLICFIVAIMFVLVLLSSSIFSKYELAFSATSSSTAGIMASGCTVALKDGSEEVHSPGDTASYIVTVSNTDTEQRSDVEMNYFFRIETTGNLPLTYTMSEGTASVSDNTICITDDTFTLENTASQTKTYELTVAWSEQDNSQEFAGETELIKLSAVFEQRI